MYTQTKGLMAVKDGRVWEYTDDVTGGNWSEQAHNGDIIYISSELTVSLLEWYMGSQTGNYEW